MSRLDPDPRSPQDGAVDVVVVGAGFGGLCALHQLRARGLTVQVFEAGSGVGGTWFWNRYPGARCDVPSLEYSFGFSDELQQEWEWSEIMPAQDEIERYLNHVADRFDLRPHIALDTRVSSAAFDEVENRWTVRTDAGDCVTATFCVMATGCLSMPVAPTIAGSDTFAGLTLQTSRWPHDSPDLEGKRIGLIGTGSSGVQATPELADVAEHLYVFQRTPATPWPAPRGPLDPQVQQEVKADYAALRREQRMSYGGVGRFQGLLGLAKPSDDLILESTEQQRLDRIAEKGWRAPRDWADVSTDLEANAVAREIYEELVRRVVDDPEVATKLSPDATPIGCKRPVFATEYFESFNRSNVSVVDLRRGAIEAITPTGIATAQGDFDLDVIVFATGFDAMTGALNKIDIRGRDGATLREAWADGVGCYLGVQSVGFPNLFFLTGPGSPSVLANVVVGLEHHVELVGGCIDHLTERGLSVVEPSVEAQDQWVDTVQDIAAGTMFTATTCNSWYVGSNVPGKSRNFLPYAGGLNRYIAHCDEVVAAGYEGFVFS